MNSTLTSRFRVNVIRACKTRKWRTVTHLAFFLLCLRFQIAAVRSAGADLAPVSILVAAGLALGIWKPWAALFAFTLAIPMLTGLGQANLLNGAHPLSLVFAALYTGIEVRNPMFNILSKFFPAKLADWHPSSHFESPSDKASDADFGTQGSRMKASIRYFRRDFAPAIVEILISAVFFSLVWQLWKHRGNSGLWPAIYDRAFVGFGDTWYFLTTAFLWLQGLYYFKLLHSGYKGRSTLDIESNLDGFSVAAWVRPVFAVYGVTMLAFCLLQYVSHIPEGWAGAGYQSPFEDISSFGSIAVSIFIFAAATISVSRPYKLAIDLIACGCLLVLVGASWSRGSWLAGLVFLTLVMVLRLSRYWLAAFIVLTLAAVVIINTNATRSSWLSRPYLARLITLVRLESPMNKESGRLNLFRKAEEMIRERPMAGYGIGSFYLTSADYARQGDPYGTKPEFAHNVFIQVAAEEGLPIALIFILLILSTLWRGLSNWDRQRRADFQGSTPDNILLGVTLALACYLETQMTANSLNVYVSNQFFFWFLMAAILAIAAQARGLDNCLIETPHSEIKRGPRREA